MNYGKLLEKELYELIKSDEKIFDFIQEGSLDGLWYWDLENPENEWMNARFWEVLGYNPKDMPHKASAWQDIINSNDLQIAIDNFNKHLSDPNHPYDQEVRYTHKNGSTVWVRCRGMAIRNKEGVAQRMLGAHQDITKQKNTEDKLLFLNKSITELITIENKQSLFDYFTNSILTVYPNAIAMYVSVSETQKECKLESVSGLGGSHYSKITKIAGTRFIGKQFKMTERHQDIFRIGKFHIYNGGLDDFSANEIPAAVANAIQKLLNINQISTIGINKNNKLLGALHIFTPIGTECVDGAFLETYVANFSSVVENRNFTTKLQESEEKFRNAMNATNDGIWDWNLKSGDVYYSPTWFKILGYEPDEFDQHISTWEKLIYPPDKDIAIANNTACVNNKIDKVNVEYRMIAKDGSLKWILGRGEAIERDKKGLAVRMVGTHVDITAQKMVEKELQEKNDHFETIIKGSNLGWWDWDIPSGEEIYNDILAENLGYELSEIKPHIDWWMDKVHPDDVEKVSGDLETHFKGETEFYENKHRLQTKTAKWKWFLDYGKVVERDSDGNPIRMIGTLRDIDYEERAKEKINASLQQIKVINANTPNVIWKSDIDSNGEFRSTYISDTVDTFLALPKGTIGHSWDKYFSYVLPKYLPLIDSCFKDSIVNEQITISFEYEVKRADGKVVWFSSTGKTVNENNKLTVYGTTIDITEKKQAEEALRDSEIRFKALHNASFGGIAIHDKGVILECNNGLSEVFGYSRDELIGMDGLQLIAEESRTKVMDYILEGYEEVYEAVGIKKNGVKFPLRLEARGIPYKSKIARVVEFRDITEQKEAQNKLRESEQMLRTIFNNSTSVIYSHDTNHVVNYVSPQVQDILGYTQEEVKGRWANLLSDNPINDIGLQLTIKAIETGIQQPPYDLEFTHKNGSKVLIEAREAPVVEDGKTVSIVGIFNDITERKRSELELVKAKEKAEESERLKSAFLANMSHEIRTPMNGILGFTTLLKNPDLSGEKRDRFIDIIRKSGDRMLSTVNDIIDISKIDAKQVEVLKADVNINEALQNQFEFFVEEAAEKGIKLSLVNKLPKDSIIISDKVKLDSIISNLIKNAIKYTDKGRIDIYCSLKGSELEFKITDTGIGISEERINSIFNRFEQADIGDTRAFEGSGLGLAISKAYVEMLGGNIGVDSEPEKGSVFYFTLPWVLKQEKSKPIKEEEVLNMSAENQINILIAEDDEFSFQYLEAILISVSKSINRVVNGKDVIDYIKNNKDIDLIFMDVKMPMIDGYKAATEIRKFNKDVIIIAQTAYALEGEKVKALAAGCNDYIAKPINQDELFALIKKYGKE